MTGYLPKAILCDTEEQPLPTWSSAVEGSSGNCSPNSGLGFESLSSMFEVQISVKNLCVKCICTKYHKIEQAEGAKKSKTGSKGKVYQVWLCLSTPLAKRWLVHPAWQSHFLFFIVFSKYLLSERGNAGLC